MLDYNTAVITLSSFKAELRKEYIDRVKRIYSYLDKFRNASIKICTKELGILDLLDQAFDLEELIYQKATEFLPTDVPTLIGKYIVTLSYYNTNLFYNVVTNF